MVDFIESHFKEEPAKYLQCFCPICLLVLREPHQVTCCGKNFCRVCIQEIRAKKQPCPTCKKGSFKFFESKELKEPLYSFQVFCSHKKDGCDWQGELGKLEEHLNVNPDPKQRLAGCGHTEIECSYCRKKYQRRAIKTHQASQCTKRPHLCGMCHEYKSTYSIVKSQHESVCKCRPVECPNLCGEKLQHQHLAEHISTKCPLSIIRCNFSDVGCSAKIQRRDLPSHLQENITAHMSLLALGNKRLQLQLQAQDNKIRQQAEKIKKQEEKIAKQAREICRQRESLEREKKFVRSFPLLTPPLDIVFSGLKDIGFTGGIISKPFYSHTGGPKLQLELIQPLVAYMIQYTFLESEFEVKTDFKLHVVAQVMDQSGENHLRIQQTLTCKGKGNDEGCSHRQTLLHIKPEHVQNDRLMIRIETIKATKL